MNRQRLLLFILLILLALAIAWAVFNKPRQKTVSVLKYAPGQQQTGTNKGSIAAPAAVSPRDDGKTLRLDLLEQQQQAFDGYRRNIFKPLFVDEVKLMQKKAAAVKPVLPPPQPPTPPVQPSPPVTAGSLPDIPQRELGRFTFLGFLKKDNQKTIFLAADKDIILVKKGETFAGRYQASSITDQALTILVKDTGEEIVIPLLENRPLNVARR